MAGVGAFWLLAEIIYIAQLAPSLPYIIGGAFGLFILGARISFLFRKP